MQLLKHRLDILNTIRILQSIHQELLPKRPEKPHEKYYFQQFNLDYVYPYLLASVHSGTLMLKKLMLARKAMLKKTLLETLIPSYLLECIICKFY